jgi:two-component system, sensor histidine kinase LadS
VWLVATLAPCGVARAEPVLELARALDGIALGGDVLLLEDATGQLDLDAVRSPEQAMRFRDSDDPTPGFGFTSSSYWVKLTVRNSSASPRTWLFELAYPHLDDVTLFVPGASGNYSQRQTGDLRPFATRDIAYRTFLFSLREPASSQNTYYLRVRSSSSMSLPLRAWDAESFLAHQPGDVGAAFFFYGIMLVMACYNLCAYFFIRQAEHIQYVLFIVSSGVLQFTLSGHLFQFVLPNQMWLVQQMIPFGFSFALATACYTGNAYLSLRDSFPGMYRTIRQAGTVCLALGPLTLPLSYGHRIMVFALCFAIITIGLVALSLFLVASRVSRAKLYVAAWGPAIIGFAVYLLRSLGVLPSSFFTDWSVQLGSSLQLVFLSSALADRINSMRRDLGDLNGELSKKVDALEGALTRAEHATKRAEEATRVKDEFMATMSHELRTPLNAIINVPQGLLRDFPKVEAVACSQCGSTFELERGEKVSGETPCPECARRGSLQPRSLVRYTGKPEHTSRYLAMIERSGKHLLQMVNGVLDFSKMEVGRLDLVLEPFDAAELLGEVCDEMNLYAERAGVQIDLAEVPEQAELTADPVRVKQVLINLLSNAIKFSDGSGVVRVSLELRPDSFEFAVQDSGIGIAPEHFERIFTSFEQVHKGNTRKYGGTGLGLSISRSLVRMHGGELWVESELNKGATFFFRIPKGLTGGRSRALTHRKKSVTAANRARRSEELAS